MYAASEPTTADTTADESKTAVISMEISYYTAGRHDLASIGLAVCQCPGPKPFRLLTGFAHGPNTMDDGCP
jgi:hypothetical protein